MSSCIQKSFRTDGKNHNIICLVRNNILFLITIIWDQMLFFQQKKKIKKWHLHIQGFTSVPYITRSGTVSIWCSDRKNVAEQPEWINKLLYPNMLEWCNRFLLKITDMSLTDPTYIMSKGHVHIGCPICHRGEGYKMIKAKKKKKSLQV